MYKAALALGTANQLTNILRDVGEDAVERDRIYVPLDDLSKFGISEREVWSDNLCQYSLQKRRLHDEHEMEALGGFVLGGLLSFEILIGLFETRLCDSLFTLVHVVCMQIWHSASLLHGCGLVPQIPGRFQGIFTWPAVRAMCVCCMHAIAVLNNLLIIHCRPMYRAASAVAPANAAEAF